MAFRSCLLLVCATLLRAEQEGVEDAQLTNDLGARLTATMLAAPGNVCFSPLGLHLALGVAHAAASGRTANQLEVVLGYKALGVSGAEIHERMHKLLFTALSLSVGRDHDLVVANGLFVQNGTEVSPEFVDALEYYYHADCTRLDFNQSESALDQINEWARGKTEHPEEPFLASAPPSETRMLLLTAVHSRGIWKIEFPAARTNRDYFYTGRRETKEVQMMSLFMETFNYYEDLELKYKFIELPYKGDRLSMLLSLPLQYDQPADLVLDATMLRNVTQRLQPTQLELVAVPRSAFRHQHSFRDDLRRLGLEDAFLPHAAAFFHDGHAGQVHLEDVVQSSWVEVEESGGHSATVTAEADAFMPVAFREITEFVANHPFLFHVVHAGSGAVLFAGRVDEPLGFAMGEELH